MSVGTYLSGTGHAALIVWMIAGWGMSSEPLPFEVTEVSVVSGEDFAAMTQGVQPDLPSGEPETIEQPVVEQAPPAPVVEAPPEVPDSPAPVEPPPVETPPQAPDLTPPETIVTDTPPDVPDTPQIVTAPQSAELGTSLRPVPRPAARVAPEIITPPEPDTIIAPDVTTATNEQSDAPVEEVVEPEEETTAPEEAADQIVTEAEAPSFAPEISSRPPSRPASVAAAAQAADEPDAPAVDPVTAALNDAGAGDPQPAPQPTPSSQGLGGGDISDGDKRSILRQIGGCWTLGSASTAAMRTQITVQFALLPGGEIDVGSIRMTSYSGGSATDADVIYRASRSALIRCANDGGRQGYDVPAEQFQTRRDLQLVFDPSQMALR